MNEGAVMGLVSGLAGMIVGVLLLVLWVAAVVTFFTMAGNVKRIMQRLEWIGQRMEAHDAAAANETRRRVAPPPL